MNTTSATSMNTANGLDLTDALDEVKRRGFEYNFAYDENRLHCPDTRQHYACEESRIIGSISVDMGTDPGDDATVYMIETDGGERGYMVIPSSFYAEPGKAAFIDRLKSRSAKTNRES